MRNNRKLKRHLNELIRLAKNIYPDLEYDIRIPGVEEIDASIALYCPQKYKDKIEKTLINKEVELLTDKNIFITNTIYNKKEYLYSNK